MLIYNWYKKKIIKDFNKFMYISHTLFCGRKAFYCYYFPGFKTEEIPKSHVLGCFKINDKQMLKKLILRSTCNL